MNQTNDTVPVLPLADYLARLGRIQHGADPIGDALDRLSYSFEALVDSGMKDANALQTMRATLCEAVKGGVPERRLYDALHDAGMRISWERFARALSSTPDGAPASTPGPVVCKAPIAHHEKVESPRKPFSPPPGVAMPAITGDARRTRRATTDTIAAMRKDATFTNQPKTAQAWVAALFGEIVRLREAGNSAGQICKLLNQFGANLQITAFREAFVALRAESRKAGGPAPVTQWATVLDWLAPQMGAMFGSGCSVGDVSTYFANRGLQLPTSELVAWCPKLTGPLLQRAELVTDFRQQYDALGGQTVAVTVDRGDGLPFVATVLCATPEDAAFAQAWLHAGLCALQQPPA